MLDQLVRSDPKILARAEEIADAILASVDVDEIADDVFGALDLDVDEVYAHSGPTAYGYVDPVEEAWSALQEAIEPFIDVVKERIRQGRVGEAARVCKGIVLGLHRHRVAMPGSDRVLGLAEDFPGEAAAEALETYFGKRTQKKPKGDRRAPLPEAFWTCVPRWSGMRARFEG